MAKSGKIGRSKQVKDELHAYYNILKGQNHAAQNEINFIKNTYLKSNLPDNTLEIFNAIDLLETLVPEIDISSPKYRLNTIHEYTNSLTMLGSYIEAYHFNPPYKEYLISLIKNISWDKLSENISQNNAMLQQNILEPIHYYLNLYNQEISNIIEEKKQRFLNASNQENGLINSEIINQIENNYEEIFFEFLKTISFINTRIEILKNKDTKFPLDAFDEGAQTTYDILESYHFIKSILIGKLGYSCIDFFRKKMNQGLTEFKKSYFRFKKKYLQNKPNNGLYNDLWPCRDANNLRIVWEEINSSGEVANDFIQTNTGIFQSEVRKVGTFLGIFPIRLSREQEMLKYVKTAEYAASMVRGEIPLNPKKLMKVEVVKSRILGLLFLKRQEYEPKRTEIEFFWESSNCGMIL